MKTIALVTLLTLSACVPAVVAPVATPQTCPSSAMVDVVKELEQKVKSKLTPLVAEKTQTFIAAFNRMKPITNHKADEIYIVVARTGAALVVIGYRGCLVNMAQTSLPVIQRLLGGRVSGGGA